MIVQIAQIKGYKFPSPCGVIGMKDDYNLSALRSLDSTVSVPLRGNWNESLESLGNEVVLNKRISHHTG